MTHGCLRFIDPWVVTSEDLPHIEDPRHAADRLDQVPPQERYRLIREMRHIFSISHSGMALHDFHQEIKEALGDGEVLLLNSHPRKPVLGRQASDAGERWVYDESGFFHDLFFCEQLAWLLHRCARRPLPRPWLPPMRWPH